MAQIFKIDPLADPRWPDFLAGHRDASIFHTPGWLAALRRTYGYQPIVYSTSAPSEPIRDGILLCRIRNWPAGSRMVSLPFSDHCQPLAGTGGRLRLLLSALQAALSRHECKSIELRPLIASEALLQTDRAFQQNEQFHFHCLDLSPDLDSLYRNLHKSCVQRKIQRAEREHLVYEEGRSGPLLEKFYHLLLLTRRRHQLPPQPISWFRNLIQSLDVNLTVRVVSKDTQPVASIITLAHKSTVVYKYGCSDSAHHNLGGMAFLFWKTIMDAKNRGATQLDLGRSDPENEGLATFKEHLGAQRFVLRYFRASQDASLAPSIRNVDWKLRLLKGTFARLPNFALKMAGNVLYRYVG